MRSNNVADDCHVHQLGLPIGDGWNDVRGERDAAAGAVRSARLHAVVLQHIVPRLALIHEQWRADEVAQAPTPEDIEAFGQAILASEPAAADHFFQRMRERGLTTEVLFEQLLAPTARRLGDLWNEDIIDFVDVTLGVNRLRVLLQIYANAPVLGGELRRRALLISAADEQHLFGLDIVASFLRSSGWEAVLTGGRSIEDCAEIVAETHFAVVGVTISKEPHLSGAARMIAAIRRASRNPAVAIMVGGWALRDRPDLAARIGGDATAEDGPGAALLAQKLYLAQVVARAKRA